MKRILTIALLALFCLLLTDELLSAQTTNTPAPRPPVQTVQNGPIKMGFIDVERAVAQSDKGKAIIDKLKAEMNQTKAKLDAQKKEVERLEADIKAKKDSWDPTTRNAKIDEYQNKAKKLNRDISDNSDYYEKRQAQQLKPILEGLNQVIMDMGKREGYSVIFDFSGTILYINPALNLTDTTIKNFNAKK
jgi:outer membrane protein